uniref:Uncharacterized protein n=1 Tax=Cacopsylla melanoneura TaxID=428564 RepID=A0A8D8QHG4_9HEMI
MASCCNTLCAWNGLGGSPKVTVVSSNSVMFWGSFGSCQRICWYVRSSLCMSMQRYMDSISQVIATHFSLKCTRRSLMSFCSFGPTMRLLARLRPELLGIFGSNTTRNLVVVEVALYTP